MESCFLIDFLNTLNKSIQQRILNPTQTYSHIVLWLYRCHNKHGLYGIHFSYTIWMKQLKIYIH